MRATCRIKVISSSSQRRARETCELMDAWRVPATFTERLYHANSDMIFKVLSEG